MGCTPSDGPCRYFFYGKCDLGQSRTADLRLRSPSLYPSELRGHKTGGIFPLNEGETQGLKEGGSNIGKSLKIGLRSPKMRLLLGLLNSPLLIFQQLTLSTLVARLLLNGELIINPFFEMPIWHLKAHFGIMGHF